MHCRQSCGTCIDTWGARETKGGLILSRARSSRLASSLRARRPEVPRRARWPLASAARWPAGVPVVDATVGGAVAPSAASRPPGSGHDTVTR
eukprot:scaffold3734_cov425-Prasinococcus_capsulatus_cf.AAC.19